MHGVGSTFKLVGEFDCYTFLSSPNSRPSSHIIYHSKMSLPNVSGTAESKVRGSSFGVSFPDQRMIFTSGSVVSGIVHVSPEKCLANDITEITVKIRAAMVSSYLTSQGPVYETKKLFGEEVSVWSSTTQSERYAGQDDIPIPFQFTIPSVADQRALGHPLPPSFRGGTWPTGFEKTPGEKMNKGDHIGRITYFIKVTGVKPKMFKRNERWTLPFVYMPPSVTFQSDVPPCLEIPPFKQWMDPADPLINPPSGWTPYKLEEDLHQNLFGKKGKLLIQLSVPSVAGFPAHTPIPYHFLITSLTRRKSGDTSAPELPFALDLNNLQMTLYRKIWTQISGGRETIRQTVARLVEHVEPSSVGNWEPRPVEMQGDSWWSQQSVHVGQFMLDVGPGFDAGPWNLSCIYQLEVRLPVKGLRNSVDEKIIQDLKVSSTEIREQVAGSAPMYAASDLSSMLFPPNYWDAIEGNNGFEAADKKG